MSVARSMVIYGLGGAASRLAAILLVPLYTRTLSVRDYGQLEVLLALHALAVLVAGLQSESAVARDYHEAQRRGVAREIIWSGLAVNALGLAALGLTACAAIVSGQIEPEIIRYVPWLIAMTIPTQLLGIQLVLLRFMARPSLFAILSFSDLTLSAMLSASFILGLHMGITGALAGIAVAKAICVACMWQTTFGPPPRHLPSPATMRAMLAYALPTMPAVLLNWLQTNGNRVLLAAFLTLDAVALTGIAIKVAALYGFVTYSFRLAWEPHSFKMLSSPDTQASDFQRAFELYAVGMMVLAAGVVIAAPLLVSVLAPSRYLAAIPLVGLFALGQFWTGALPILSVGVQGARLTSRITYIYLVGAAVNVALLVVLASALGMMAAGIGNLAGAIVSAGLAAHYSDRLYGIRYDRRLLAFSTLASATICAAAALLGANQSDPARGLIATGTLSVLATFVILALVRYGLPADHRRDLRDLVWSNLGRKPSL